MKSANFSFARRWLGAPAAGGMRRESAYAFAVAVTAAALLARWGMGIAFGDRPWLILLLLPIMLSAYVGGLGAGLLSTGLTAAFAKLFLFPPLQQPAFAHLHDLVQWLIFVGEGVIVSLLIAALQRSRRRLEAMIEESHRATEVLRENQTRLQEAVRERERAEAALLRFNADLERKVAERTAEIEAANRELESFAYTVSHDLRAPLRHVMAFSQIMSRHQGREVDEEVRDCLAHILNASTRMGELIDGLLQLCRISQGEMRCQTVGLSQMAERLLAEFARAEPQRQVEWAVEPGLEVRGDSRMLEALLANLLGNAWKYTARTARPRIRIYRGECGGEPLFCVADNGAGFDMANAGRLFEPFQRLHGQGEFPGLGIGLATAQRIVHRHGGVIRASAAPGEGATFCFTLPAPTAEDGTEKGERETAAMAG